MKDLVNKMTQETPFKINEIEMYNRKFKVIERIEKKGRNNAGNQWEGTKEKREINELIAKHFLNKDSKIIDAYAGFGISTYLWLKQNAKVLAIENDKPSFNIMEENLKEYKDKLEIYNESNLNILNILTMRNEKYDMIDLDPFASCYEQVVPALKLIDNGLLLCTCGEPTILFRHYHTKDYRRRYNLDERFFTVKEFWKFPKEFFFEKYIKSLTNKKVELIHYFQSHLIGRLIIKIGDPKIPKELIEELNKRDKAFGLAKTFNGQKNLDQY